jgi:hypothetical protein
VTRMTISMEAAASLHGSAVFVGDPARRWTHPATPPNIDGWVLIAEIPGERAMAIVFKNDDGNLYGANWATASPPPWDGSTEPIQLSPVEMQTDVIGMDLRTNFRFHGECTS